MRARFALAILTGCLAATAAAGGCQIISQLNDLQVGMAGSASSTTSTSSTTTSATSTTTSATSTTTSATSTSSTGGPPCDSDGGGTCMSPPCPSCGTDGVCRPACDTMNGCASASPDAGAISIHVEMGPAAMQCNGSSCAGKTFACSVGPYLCELDCADAGACTNTTTLQCGEGPCRLSCAGMGCQGTTIVCGQGPCDVQYFLPNVQPEPPLPVTQKNCSQSCACTGHNNDPGGPAWMPPAPDAG